MKTCYVFAMKVIFRLWIHNRTATQFEPRHEKAILVSELVRHKPSCTSTDDDWRLEILDIESRGIVLSM